MSGLQALAQEMIWFDKSRYDEAERCFYEGTNGIPQTPQERDASTILQDIAKARQSIQQSLARSQNASKSEDQSELVSRLKCVELDNENLHNVVDDLRSMLLKLESRMAVLENSQAPAPKTAPVNKKSKVEEHNGVDDDDDIDLFGSDEEDEEAERIKAERVKEYSARKAKKPVLIAKSSILLDVKPWDDETDMGKLERCVRSVQLDGLLWGASKLVPVGYGIKKLQINCVVEDDKVGTDILEEEITQFEDYVQSVDIAAFNKI
ncbi:elongation factor 1-delta-like isoform X2 [Xyrauchen texanus]|uniref:elongation factor 1-delta-like isoform X2 n=1 Tax=Xyrauchen texanus TaxID=154827 RepID=UPI0022426F72|nr:elongation factor 1-delta-like isoform X2 [Xyrauchen texanus]